VLSRQELLGLWESGWTCLLDALESLHAEDLEKIIYIRNEGHTVMEAINRQLAHYSYHVGQIVFIAKMLAAPWQSLSIPANASAQFNADRFAKEKMRRHFTDGIFDKDPETEG
jgi:hypothetical protein